MGFETILQQASARPAPQADFAEVFKVAIQNAMSMGQEKRAAQRAREESDLAYQRSQTEATTAFGRQKELEGMRGTQASELQKQQDEAALARTKVGKLEEPKVPTYAQQEEINTTNTAISMGQYPVKTPGISGMETTMTAMPDAVDMISALLADGKDPKAYAKSIEAKYGVNVNDVIAGKTTPDLPKPDKNKSIIDQQKAMTKEGQTLMEDGKGNRIIAESIAEVKMYKDKGYHVLFYRKSKQDNLQAIGNIIGTGTATGMGASTLLNYFNR